MQPKARVSFLMPHRWLNEDKEFLIANLKKQFIKDWGQDHLYELEGIPAYSVNVICRANKPVKEELTKAQVQLAFKQFFPIGKCIRVDNDFVQHKSRTMLPVLELQVFF